MNAELLITREVQFKQVLMQWLENAKGDAVYGSTIFGGGDILRLENICKRYFSARYAVAVSSGTAALHCALLGLRLVPKTIVYVIGSDWSGIPALIMAVGCNPVLIQNASDLANPDTAGGGALIHVRKPGDAEERAYLKRFCRTNHLPVIEDWSAMPEFETAGKRAPLFGSAAICSFGYNKAVQCGEGGILLTNNRDLYRRAVLFSQHAVYCKSRMISRGRLTAPALNYRINPLSAALACMQLGQLLADET